MASIDDTPTVIIRRTEDGGHDAASSLHSHADLLGCEAVSRLVQASAREPRHNQRSLSESGLLRWLPSHIVVPSGQQSLCWPS
ncbi:hypothetical protein DOTSEDRAFT_67733 [Dothistroma septosporum NZE10]|uniref:Uncharacterized protein n=1 Tax=Dothistroma septosporum (strain NZE10 / CBS 128990) TaxID=675120 RepID=N1Q2T0_DOTSN|nr:hypothetical protein DOTSEDRAFT_67733 [Dothistroma septosporum NZE10]